MNLAQLINFQKMGRTFATLEDDCGGYPSAQRIQQMASKPPKNFPDPDTIRALARGLRVTEVAVVLASAESLGLDVSRATPAVLDYLPPGVNELDENQLFAIGNLIRSFIPEARQDEPSPAETALASEVRLIVPHWSAPDESEDSAPDQAIVDSILRQREEYERQAAARKPPPGGSRGRQARRAQDEDATESQDRGDE